ncbi:hypothetical protein [Xanthomarina gelatinilytica]|jgi:hypothetical protein|uniref:hypothetical protein n=1 Tax=Xanthomarina gelatinilytica TaxID=1137281 RepID=UPI003AA7B909|tara:strand:+ start:6138 stop:6536 length:399 start_codon:yes stop_codon:yes gene_type:complete
MKNNFVKKIDKAIISQMLEDNSSLLDSELEAVDYNINEIEEFSQKMFKRQSFFINGYINKRNDEQLLEKATKLLHQAIERHIEKPVSYLKNLIKNNEFQIQYRNLENLTIEEIKDIIKDQNLLEILEKLDNE